MFNNNDLNTSSFTDKQWFLTTGAIKGVFSSSAELVEQVSDDHQNIISSQFPSGGKTTYVGEQATKHDSMFGGLLFDTLFGTQLIEIFTESSGVPDQIEEVCDHQPTDIYEQYADDRRRNTPESVESPAFVAAHGQGSHAQLTYC